MHILVTGGCGFIGSHLVRALISTGHDVTIVDNMSAGKKEHIPSQAHLKIADTTTQYVFDSLIESADCCVHLAAVASVELCTKQSYKSHQSNIGGLINLYDTITRIGKKTPVIYASSSAVYGNNNNIPLKETERPAPISTYGADKLACEMHSKIVFQTYGISNMGLRMFNLYGPNQDASSPHAGVIALFLNAMRQQSSITIYGSGEHVRDFVFIDDAINAFTKAIDMLVSGHQGAEIVNICSGTGISINELASIMAKKADKPLEINKKSDRLSNITHSVGSIDHAKSLLGYSASISLNEGLDIMFGLK